MRRFRALPLLALIASAPALAEPAAADIARLLEEMQGRLARLEARNAELERQFGALAEVEAQEHAMTNRLKDLEINVSSLREQARRIETLSGVSVGASMTMVAQKASRVAPGTDASQLNYRGDVSVTLPAGEIGESQGRLFTHFRLGQGAGVSLPPTLTGGANSTTFQHTNPDDTAAALAQAWYQLDVPLDGNGRAAKSHLEINFGKIDPFVFFDQNRLADDESEGFLNNVFVHNPLLDSGGDAGVDSYGFSPGMRLAYHSDGPDSGWWRASLGVFGSGPGASFSGGLKQPFVIGQLEMTHSLLPGREAGYRLYAWRNGRALALDGVTEERHAGWGVSLDQQVGDHLALFGRYGQSSSGQVGFDRALTLGGQLDGSGWGRADDRVGLALGWLRSSADYRALNPGFSGAEKQAELYYVWQANDQFHLSPSVQWISRPGGDPAAKSVSVVGLRAKVSY